MCQRCYEPYKCAMGMQQKKKQWQYVDPDFENIPDDGAACTSFCVQFSSRPVYEARLRRTV
jgi:hypothetical protein